MKKLGLIMLAVSLAVGFTFLGCDQTFAVDTAAMTYAKAKADEIEAIKAEPPPIAPFTITVSGTGQNATDQWSNGFYIRANLTNLPYVIRKGATIKITGTITPSAGAQATGDNFQIQYVCTNPWTAYGETGTFGADFTANTPITVNQTFTTTGTPAGVAANLNTLNIQTAKAGGNDGGAGTAFTVDYNLTILVTPPAN